MDAGLNPECRFGRIGFHQPLGCRGHGQDCLTPCATSWASPSPSVPIRRTASLLGSPRWQRAYNAGARPQRLLWASTGTKDPKASDILYIKALAAPFTVNTMPEGTLKALADHGEIGALLPADGGDCEEVLARFAKAGIDVDAPGRPASGRRRQVVRKIVERPDERDRVQERRAHEPALRSLEVRRLGFPHECPGRRCRRHARQDPGDRASTTPRKIPVGTDADAQTDGRRRQEARRVAGSMTLVSIGYPGPVLRQPARCGATQPRAPDGSGSTSKTHSAIRSSSSTMRQCRRSEVTRAGKCSFSAWAPAWDRR